MSTATQAEQLRARARHVRNVSSTISSSRALTVYRLAGPETWVGPTAQACLDALLTVRPSISVAMGASFQAPTLAFTAAANRSARIPMGAALDVM